MKSLLFGFIGIIVVMVLSLDGDPKTYLQMHSIIIVIGGTFVLLFFATPGAVYPRLWAAMKMLVSKEELFTDYSSELENLAKTRTLTSTSNNALINYANELWEQGIDSNLFVTLISQKKMELENETVDSVQALKNLAKYPPALGMTGTVMGMISLFASLDSNKGNIGQSLALAMTATFFGLALTNIVLGPLADRLHVRHVNRKRMIQNLYQIILLINQGEPVQLISGEVEDRVA